jgi:hypothetical protein
MSQQTFKAVTKHAGKLKTLFEVIFLNTTTANWTIDQSGMLLEEMTTQKMLINIFLPASFFDEYVFEGEPAYVGLGSHINREFFKSVKNKDVVTLYMTTPWTLCFQKANDNISQTLEVATQDIQVIQPVLLPRFTRPAVQMHGDSFNQLCRSFTTPIIEVTKTNGRVSFSFSTGRSVKTLTCGQEDKHDLDLLHRSFYSEQFSRISKIHSFASSPIDIFYEQNAPLCLQCKSQIGTITVLVYEKQDD